MLKTSKYCEPNDQHFNAVIMWPGIAPKMLFKQAHLRRFINQSQITEINRIESTYDLGTFKIDLEVAK